MNVQKLSNSPLVRAMVYNIIKSRQPRQNYSQSRQINTSMVPRVSQKVVNRGMLIERRVPMQRPPQRPMMPLQQMIRPATTTDFLEQPQDYGKLQPLLLDQTVSSIECPGADKPLTIVRAGQVQGTKIALTQEEISYLLKRISEKSRIPLVDGVFRAAVDNFVISAVVSGVIGSRFVIKKQTPYSLLEGGRY